MPRFRRLQIRDWQHLSAIDITFDSRLTTMTGANGSGKSTLLRFLARHFGWDYSLLRTPRRNASGLHRYLINFLRRSLSESQDQQEIGEIEYDSGSPTKLTVPTANTSSAAYEIAIQNPQKVEGLYLPSDRPEFLYSKIQQIPLKPRTGYDAFNEVQQSIRSFSRGGRGNTPVFHIKEALIGLALFGYGNQAVEPDHQAREIYERFQEILRIVLPPDIGFRTFSIREASEVVLVTESGEFLLDAVSGGIGALIMLTWQIFMYSQANATDFTVVIDEPENHLHPGMQRTLMPALLDAFPAATFIISTHSPLVVGSVRDSLTYVLRFNDDHEVESLPLDLKNKAGSASEILQEALGLPFTMPIWVEHSLAAITDRYARATLTRETLNQLRQEIADLGLERWFPETLSNILGAGPSQ